MTTGRTMTPAKAVGGGAVHPVTGPDPAASAKGFEVRIVRCVIHGIADDSEARGVPRVREGTARHRLARPGERRHVVGTVSPSWAGPTRARRVTILPPAGDIAASHAACLASRSESCGGLDGVHIQTRPTKVVDAGAAHVVGEHAGGRLGLAV